MFRPSLLLSTCCFRQALASSSTSIISALPSCTSCSTLSTFKSDQQSHFLSTKCNALRSASVSRGVHHSAGFSQRHQVMIGIRINMADKNQAGQFIEGLTNKEKQMLLKTLLNEKQLKKLEQSSPGDASVDQSDPSTATSTDGPETEPDPSTLLPVNNADLRTLFLLNTIPFIGFGFLDNFIMIICGEYIDMTLGIYLHMSTMAAAGFGNLISDAIGVGAGGYIEYLVHRFTNLQPPRLTAEQMTSARVRYVSSFGRTVGIIIGCLVGMCPLLFFDQKKKNELEDKESNAEEKS